MDVGELPEQLLLKLWGYVIISHFQRTVWTKINISGHIGATVEYTEVYFHKVVRSRYGFNSCFKQRVSITYQYSS
jgi:hypothetical protein